MSNQLKPIKLWGVQGANPPKVAIILAELNLPYEVVPVALSNVKSPEFLAVNPNGRIPAIHDPNTDLTLWESGAIVEYLIERYDTTHKLSFPPGTANAYHAKQWFFFQATGQGPYYGQAAWFMAYHAEKVPSAIERYVKEVNRVSGVLDGYLAKQKRDGADGPWLVGGKMSYADLAFVAYQRVAVKRFEKEHYNEDDFPHVKEWLNKMLERPTVKDVFEKADADH